MNKDLIAVVFFFSFCASSQNVGPFNCSYQRSSGSDNSSKN